MSGKMNVIELIKFLEDFNFWTNLGRTYPAFYQWLEMAADKDGWVETQEVQAGMDSWDFRHVEANVVTTVECWPPVS